MSRILPGAERRRISDRRRESPRREVVPDRGSEPVLARHERSFHFWLPWLVVAVLVVAVIASGVELSYQFQGSINEFLLPIPSR